MTDEDSQRFMMDPTQFSIRLTAENYTTRAPGEACANQTLLATMEAISKPELMRLGRGVAQASELYSYFSKSPSLPDNPFQQGILPDGGAANALVTALAQRALGQRCHACQAELEQVETADATTHPPEPCQFKC
jgi:hypothetical protein